MNRAEALKRAVHAAEGLWEGRVIGTEMVEIARLWIEIAKLFPADEPAPPSAPFTVHHLDGTKTVTGGEPTPPMAVMRGVLDGWIEGSKINHEALGHRDNCCETFHPEDIRRMIEDAEREIGTPPQSVGKVTRENMVAVIASNELVQEAANHYLAQPEVYAESVIDDLVKASLIAFPD